MEEGAIDGGRLGLSVERRGEGGTVRWRHRLLKFNNGTNLSGQMWVKSTSRTRTWAKRHVHLPAKIVPVFNTSLASAVFIEYRGIGTLRRCYVTYNRVQFVELVSTDKPLQRRWPTGQSPSKLSLSSSPDPFARAVGMSWMARSNLATSPVDSAADLTETGDAGALVDGAMPVEFPHVVVVMP